MLLLNIEQLSVLQDRLLKDMPQSIKVYGAVQIVRKGNPFKLEVLVDSWPDFKTVLCRPQKEGQDFDLDEYLNGYTLFTKEPSSAKNIMIDVNVIDWNQVLRLEGLQLHMEEVIQEVATSKNVRIECYANTAKTFLREEPCDLPDDLKQEGDSGSKVSHLEIHHANLINSAWKYGGGQGSSKFVQQCVSHLPSCCLLDVYGNPVSWMMLDQFCTIRNVFTLQKERGKGHSKHLVALFSHTLHRLGYPIYCHTDEGNIVAEKLFQSLKFTATSFSPLWLRSIPLGKEK